MEKIGKVDVVDLFCGIGGMSHGFVMEGFNIKAGIDSDSTCKFGYETNNNSKFINADIKEINSAFINGLYTEGNLKILIGCAPCQPFSNLNINKGSYEMNNRVVEKSPLDKFITYIKEVKPSIVSMENVRGLTNIRKYPIFGEFLNTLKTEGYYYSYEIVDCAKYGIPQTRKRLVLLASKFGEIKLIPYTHEGKSKTVFDAIGDLPELKDGETNTHDIYHKARKLNPLNLKRVKKIKKNGGTLIYDAPELIPDCHKKETGLSYRSGIYARMKWELPSPTMTTLCVGIGNGRFGHPEQDRAISLREAARFQTFPDYYEFAEVKDNSVPIGSVARHIGNAVPVELGKVIAKSIKIHLKLHNKT